MATVILIRAALMRVIVACKGEILPYIMTIVDKLSAILLEVAKNPGRPRFNHYMFEAFGCAIRWVACPCSLVLCLLVCVCIETA